MGIFQRGDVWYVRIFLPGSDGKWTKKTKAIGTDRKAAEAVQKKLEAERSMARAAGIPWTGLKKMQKSKASQNVTFGQAFQLHLEQTSLKPSSLLNYRDIYRAHLEESFGSMPLNQITKEHVIAFQNKLKARRYGPTQKPLSPTRINNVVNVLRTVMNRAFEDEIISDNPSAKVKRLREEDAEIDPLTLEELHLVLKHMDPFYVPVFTMLAWSGMRPNELKALRWDDIDWHRNEIRISKGIVRKLEGTTKTKSSKRIIQMHPEVRRVLEQRKPANQTLVSLRSLIFMSKKGDTLSHHLDDIWRKALKKADLRHRPSYQLRHTWASMALRAGEDPLWVAKMLGHSNAAITFKHYVRFIPSERHGKMIANIGNASTPAIAR